MIESKLFDKKSIIVYPNLTSDKIKYTFNPDARQITELEFNIAKKLIKNLTSELIEWYVSKFDKPFNPYKLGTDFQTVQKQFWNSSKFKSALELLKIPLSKKEKIYLPWWNELACAELNHKYNETEVNLNLTLRHSYETQLIRSGELFPIKSVSVGGLILTKDNQLLIGIRGGNTYPNTYHINAGSMSLTKGMKLNNESIFELFYNTELNPEMGIEKEDIANSFIYSRIMDYAIENGPMYNFLVKTNLSSKELSNKWKNNVHSDKQEHKEIFFINSESESINYFIKTNYRGAETSLQNNSGKPLLHSGALCLASVSGMSLNELKFIANN